MTQTHFLTGSRATTPAQHRRWPLTAAAAGLCGVVPASLQMGEGPDPWVFRASRVIGYLAVTLLLVTAAYWRRRIEPRVPGSTAARLVPLGLVASAAGLAYDPGAHTGWLGVVVAAGAVAWMALRERTVSRWLGVVSVVPVLQTAVMVGGLGLPGAPALLGPLWLVVAGLGLGLGRSTIVR